MTVFLGMYDPPPLQPHNDLFWYAIRLNLMDAPQRLMRGGDPWDIWQSPDLLLAQTCGYPFRAHLHGKVRLVGTPDYGLPDCPPGYYFSVLIARADDERGSLAEFGGARFAYNEALSQSGWAAPIHLLLNHGIRPGALVKTGAHLASARAVAEGRAELASIDALTFMLFQEHAPDLVARLRILARTEPTPGLPLITGMRRNVFALRKAIETAIPMLPERTRRILHLKSLCQIAATHYLSVPTPPTPADLVR